MRRFYFTAAAGLVFAGLLVAWLVWLRPQPSRQVTSPAVLSVKPEEVQAIAIEHEGKLAVEIRRGPEGWQIERPRRVPTSASAVDALLGELAPLSAARLVAERTDDPAAFGLAPPKASLILTMADGTVRRLLVGNQTPVSQGIPAYYARDEASPAVYTIDSYVAEQITGSWEQFRERRLAAFGADDVQAVRVDTGQGAVEARRNPDPSSPAERRWRLVAPYGAPGDTLAIDQVLRDLEFARIARFVDDEPSASALASYGLSAPRARIELTYVPQKGGDDTGAAAGEPPATERAVLLVGGDAGEGEVYVKRGDQPFVYTVPVSDLQAALDATAERWVRHRVLGLARSEIQRLSFSMSGRPGPFTLEKDPSGQWTIAPGSVRPKDDEVENLFDALWRLQAQRVGAVGRAAAPPQPGGSGGAAVVEITVAGHDTTPVTRLVFEVPLTEPAAAGGQAPARRVFVEQGADRLGYEVRAEDLRPIESVIAQWTAPDRAAASSPSASR